MAERSNGKKSTSGTTLDLMGEEEAAPPRAARKVAAPAPAPLAAQAAPAEVGGALFGGDEVDLDARHPADVPVGNFPAPSQIAQVDEDAGDPFAEDDPFEDTVMARMLADEPAPLSSPLRAAREEFNLRTDDEAPPVDDLPAEEAPAPVMAEASPIMEVAAEPAVEDAEDSVVEAVAHPDLEAFADPVAVPEVEQKLEQEELMPPPAPAPAAKTPAAPKAAPKTAKTNAPGLTIPRRYTQPGQDVWATVEWELRTASIVGSDGTVVFEQKGVEIPKAWSQLATNVVVSKYFRGQVGTLEREYSVKQLIGRVADRILGWGKQGGYFASDADADAFHDELRYTLLHQYAAFNSPVWFNLGWAGRRQAVSACYINEVNDTMESILDLYKTEGMLFKDGSGCTSGDSLVHVRDAGFLPIRNLYKKFLAEGRPVHEFDGKGRYIEVGDADVHTLSINRQNGRFGQDQVLRVWQYDLPQEDKLTVRLDTGAKATVSCWHPFLVWDGEKITHRRADQLRRGDAVLGPNASAQAAVPTRPTTFEYRTTYFDRDESHVVALDEDLAWLCGYFMGDGSLGAKKSRVTTTSGRLCTYDSLRLRFYDETEDTLRRVQQIIGRVFGEQVQISQGQCCPMLTYNGRRVTRFFEQLFGVGSKTYSLSMPAFVWNSPRAVQLAFLAGLIDSDGYVAAGGRAKYSSASREFAGHVAALASFLGLGGGAVEDRHVTTVTVLHRVASSAQRQEFAAHLAHPERRRRLLETCSDKPQRKFCLPLSETIAHDLFGNDRTPAEWLSVPLGDSTFHLGRLKYGGLINPFKLQKALAALDRDDDLTRLLTQVAESAAFVFSVEPCAEDPDFYDLTVRDHNNYLAGENGLVVIHNSGLNLSTLRSSKEPLEAGGRSSGPISFMKGLDASAGSIKSGGSTRRAACMRVLDIDHPDVKEFIDCKKDAEEKAHALIDAGYSGAFNVAGGAYDTVPFQNANHSVRVTDDFMRAVEADAAWDTKFRLSGKSAETYRARDLMRGIAEGTWVCGDPGMQYDTTINDWHTCANTDRIYASNPCVTGDTLVATSEGWQRIDSLVGQSARVIGADGQPHFVDRIFPTGHKPVFNLRTRAGFEVTITGNHQVLTTERGDVAVEDLRLGEHVQLEGAGFGRRALNESLALAIGVAVGDGCLTRQNIRGREQEYVILTMSQAEAPILEKLAAELNHQKDILRAAGLCGHPGSVSVVPQSTSGTSRLTVGSAPVVEIFKEFAVLDKGSSAKQFTPAAYELDRPTLATVLRGLFTADGTVANYGDKSQYVSLDSTSKDLLQQVQMLLLSFGIKSKMYLERRGGKTEAMMPNSAREPQSYTVQEMHSLRISKASRVIFEREIGFDPGSAKSARLRDMNLAFTTYKDTLTDEVVSITEAGAADVYDLTEGVTHHFVVNGLVVHNCSEYMFLNSTACNLSSLNLMKFRQEGTGAFDTDSFEHAVRLMITAQEIVVGFASYPTAKIEQRSHEYRTLGLGYANLGALLMAAGLPYDSDAGRAYAGAVTALMTGRAYHQSAAIARDCGGPFSGFAENRAPMLRVMGKHRDHVDQINGTLIPDTLLAAARTAWDEAIEEGEAAGYRNAQTSVLAPTGCLVAGSLVITDRGVVRLNRLGDVNGAQWQDVSFGVLTDEGQQQATKFYVNGRDQTRRVITHCGYAIQGTPKHRVKVVDAQTGRWDWKRFADVVAGDIVPLSLGQMIGEAQSITLPPLGEEYWTGDYTTRVPRTMTPDLAEFIGYFMGDGSMHSKGPRFCVANTDPDVGERVKSLVKSLFNLDARLTPQQGYCEVAVHSVPLTLWWEACGFSKVAPGPDHSGKGYLPRIPDAVLATNDPTVYGAFLRGLYEADGTVTNGIPCWSTVHRPFSEEVKTLLLALGIPTTTKQDTTGWSQSALWVLRLRNTSYTGRYLASVGFMSARKAALVSQSDGVQAARHDYIYLAPEVIHELVPLNSPLGNAVSLSMKRHNGAVTRRAAESLYAATRDERVAHALRFFYDTVAANEDGGEHLTYDLSVPGNVTYVAQGFVSHNTIGFLMDCDTTGIEPDIAIVKYKSLVGGGMMKIVNQTVPEALERLGYDEAQVEGILKFIDEHDTIEGAPDLRPEHLPIFDCAFRPMNGTRSIHYRGHIKMMAAAQPFISGAISKTVNIPNDATPEDIAETYLEAWKLGIKAVAIYRDGSKRTQPLNTGKEAPSKEKTAQATEAAASPVPLAPPKAVRRRLPDERAGLTHKFSIGGHEGYLTVGLYPDTNQPGEIFIRMSKEGSSISGLMDSFATAISLALQYGVPLSTLVDKFIHSRFEPSGFTGNKEIPMAKSVMDYIFRYLALRFLQKEDRHNVGLLADQDDSAYAAPTPANLPAPPPAHDAKSGSLSNGNGKNGNGSGPKSGGDMAHLAETNTAAITDHEREIYRMQSDAPPCPECGAITIRSGACYKCLSCGTSLGCS